MTRTGKATYAVRPSLLLPPTRTRQTLGLSVDKMLCRRRQRLFRDQQFS
jgi:hypothetical protein